MENKNHPANHDIESLKLKVKKVEDKNLKQTLMFRIVLCFTEVLLLWITSLNNTMILVDYFIPSPTVQFIYKECQDSFNTILTQKSDYKVCISAQLDRCNTNLDESTIEQEKSLTFKKEQNKNTLDYLQRESDDLNSQYEILYYALKDWSEVNVDKRIVYTVECSVQNQSYIQYLLGRDGEETSSSILDSANQYAQQNDRRVNQLANFNLQTMTYNSEYMMKKFSNANSILLSYQNSSLRSNLTSLSDIEALNAEVTKCLNISHTGPCKFGKSAGEIYDELKLEMDIQLLTFENQMSAYKNYLSSFGDDVSDAMDNANKFYDAIAGTQGLIKWVSTNTPGFSVVSDLCKLSSPNWCEFSKSSWLVSIPKLPNPIPLRDFPSAKETSAVFASTYNEIKVKMQSYTNSLRVKANNLQDSFGHTMTSLNLSNVDYSPPKYMHIINESIQQSEASRQFLSKLTANISQLSDPKPLKDQLNSDFSFSDSSGTLKFNEMSLYNLLFGPWLVDKLNLTDLLLLINSIKTFFILLDYIYRGYRSFSIINKHLTTVSPQAPLVDIRQPSSLLNTCCFKTKSILIPANVQLFINFIAYTWFYILILIIFIVMVAVASLYLYLPMYYGYIDYCVDKNIHSRDVINSNNLNVTAEAERVMYNDNNTKTHVNFKETLLIRNLNSLAYNFASLDGNQDASIGISQFNSKSTFNCNSRLSSSNQNYQNDKMTFHKMKYDYYQKLSDYNLLVNCINISSMHDLFTTICEKNQKNNNDTSLGQVGPKCHDDMSLKHAVTTTTRRRENEAHPLESTVFQCDELPTCNFTCSGPNKDIISTVNSKCGCLSEWFFHSFIIRVFMFFCVYLILNVSRSLICKGLGLVFWNSISLGSYEYIGTCDHRGRKLHSFDTNKDKEEVVIKKNIKKIEKNFFFKGIVFILAGVFINLPYIYLFMTLKSKIEYHSSDSILV